MTDKIFTTTTHWYGYPTTKHTFIQKEAGGLNPWPNYPLSAATLLTTIKYFSSVEMKATSMTAPLVTGITETSTPSTK